jgi:hypothetical protein
MCDFVGSLCEKYPAIAVGQFLIHPIVVTMGSARCVCGGTGFAHEWFMVFLSV